MVCTRAEIANPFIPFVSPALSPQYGPAAGLGCFDCGRGKFISTEGATSETQCSLCPIGKSSPATGLPSSCESCQSGRYAPAEGYAQCAICDPGTACEEEATEMQSCSAGSFSGAGAGTCTTCSEGTHASADESSACVTCNAGKYCPEGATEELLCPKGKYSNNGAGSCISCSAGSFSDSPDGPTECLTCDAGTFCPSEATTEEPCPAGRFSNFGAGTCTECGPAAIAPDPSSPSCLACDANQVANANRTECVCQQGFYTGLVANEATPVPKGVSPDTPGMTLQTLDLLPGHYRTNSNSTEILPCLNEDHCVGGSDPSSYCAEGYTGPLCAVCSSGYAAIGAGESLSCNQCSGSSTATVAVGVLLIVFLLSAVLVYRFKEKSLVRGRLQSFHSAISVASEKFEKVSFRSILGVIVGLYTNILTLTTCPLHPRNRFSP